MQSCEQSKSGINFWAHNIYVTATTVQTVKTLMNNLLPNRHLCIFAC